jgi:hypothetical protein
MIAMTIGVTLVGFQSRAKAQDVAFAGLAYSGDSQTISTRFPYSKRFDASLPGRGIDGIFQKDIATLHPKNLSLVGNLDELKGRDQAVVVAFVITNENLSTEKIGSVYKLLIQIRGQVLFFDFKSMTVLRVYPVSFAYIDALMEAPSEGIKDRDVGYVFNGSNGKPGLLSRFEDSLVKAALPAAASRYLQVSSVEISDEAKVVFPAEYGGGVAEAWLADTFSEKLSAALNIPILPYSKGYAIGNRMAIKVSDSTVYDLTLPKPDYEFDIDLLKLKTVPYDVKAAGKSLIYGTLVSVKLEEPLSSHVYLDSQFKNGEVKIVPVSQAATDDFPAYEDSINGLFTKLSGVISGDNNSWIKSASVNQNTDKEISATRELLKLCK